LLEQRQMLLPVQLIKNNEGDIILGQDAGEQIDPKEISNYLFNGLIQKVSINREKMTDSKLKEISLSL
jgi:hypothetical protein